MASRRSTTSHYYVDNKALFECLVAHREEVMQCRAEGREAPPVPEYVGECIYRIASRLSSKLNFSRYTFRDDMIGDAIENSFQYLYNFDPAKSQNPFAYFTQICHYAFLRRIEKEKKHTYTKLKVAQHQSQQHLDYVTQDGESVNLSDPSWLSYENIHEFIRDYEAKVSRSRQTDDKEDALSEDVVSFDLLDAQDEGATTHDDGMETSPDKDPDDPDEL